MQHKQARPLRACRLISAAAWAFLVLALAVAPLPWTPRAAATEAWTSPHFQDHPLAGTIWTSNFEAVTPSQLQAVVSEANFVLLGEIHVNADHHRLQARLINALAADGRHPAIVFEMIPVDLQTDLDRHLQGRSGDASGLGKVLRWEERGWPDWAIYRPIAEAALAAKLPLWGSGLNADAQKAIAKGKPSPNDPQTVEALGPEAAKALGQEINEAHCNLLPATAMEPMLRVQRARDAHMAKVMLSARPGDGAVLIAGSGHVRNDWAVPHIIRQASPGATTVSIAFMEVDPERTSPSEYVQAIPGLAKPYDFIYLTPRADLTDHCAELAKHLDKKKSGTSEQR